MNPLNAGLLTDLFAELEKCGYLAGPPLWVSPDARAIDALCAAEMVCGACGHVGCGYYPFQLVRPPRYRAYAVCPACGFYEEV
jgi:hypothetical protein